MALAEVLEPDRCLVVAREVTKRFETFEAMTAQEIADWCKSHEPRGEYVIAVDEKGAAKGEEVPPDVVSWAEAIAKELPLSKTAGIVARQAGVKRDTIYRLLESRRSKDD